MTTALAAADRRLGARRLAVGFDVRELIDGRRTGIARYVVNLVDRWRRPDARVSATLYGNERTTLPSALADVPVRRMRERATLWWDQVSLSRALAADRIDVFLSPYYKAPLSAPCPVVLTIHDLLFLDERAYPQRGRRRALRMLFVPMARAMARRAARIVTDSEHSRRDIVRLLGVSDEKIRVVPIGLAPTLAPVAIDERAGVGARYGVVEPYALYVGNFKPHKNLPRLLRAWASLGARARGQLVLAGTRDADATALETLARDLGVADRVRFTGFVADADLAALYSGAAAVVLPSLYEGFGVPVIEAMACGAPVVCSNTTSLREVAGDAALLVDPEREDAIADGLARVLADDDLRGRLVAAGRARATTFDVEKTGAAIEAVLAEAVEERRR
jgi:glycosyltransferase involved in cell wall biosynthesis